MTDSKSFDLMIKQVAETHSGVTRLNERVNSVKDDIATVNVHLARMNGSVSENRKDIGEHIDEHKTRNKWIMGIAGTVIAGVVLTLVLLAVNLR